MLLLLLLLLVQPLLPRESRLELALRSWIWCRSQSHQASIFVSA
jgi:hypothetical protein